jgi:hypothetical protein
LADHFHFHRRRDACGEMIILNVTILGCQYLHTESSVPTYRPTGIAALGTAALVSVAGCNSVPIPTTVPTSQSFAGLSPAGTVSLTETFVGGFGEGKGVLTYRGKKCPFRLIGTVIGPGSVSTIDAAGEVYKLNGISEFPGPYAQGTGAAGLETSGASDLWLQNKAGVIMHLSGTQSGVTLSLGRDEILIKMVQ